MTMQRHDTIIYKGEHKIIISEPLKKYFETTTQPNFNSLNPSMTSRGYYADWIIDHAKLFLVDFMGHQLTNNWNLLQYNLTDLFKNIRPPIFAKWFSGYIIIPFRENVRTSINPMYEKYLKLGFEKGCLTGEEEVSEKDLTATNKSIATM